MVHASMVFSINERIIVNFEVGLLISHYVPDSSTCEDLQICLSIKISLFLKHFEKTSYLYHVISSITILLRMSSEDLNTFGKRLLFPALMS